MHLPPFILIDLIVLKIFFKLHVYIYKHVHVSPETHRVHKRASDILHLELQAVVPDMGAVPYPNSDYLGEE